MVIHVNFMFQQSLSMRSKMGRNMRHIFYRNCLYINYVSLYTPSQICKTIRDNWFAQCKSYDIQSGAQIRDLVFMRDSYDSCFLSKRECKDLICTLCTS